MEISKLTDEDVSRAKALSANLLTVALVLCGLGIIMIYSASAQLYGRFGSSWYFLVRQATFAGVGLAGLLVASKINYRLYGKFASWFFGASIILLVLVLIPGIGEKFNGARRWIRFGAVGFQPSDIAKVAMIFFLAKLLVLKQAVIRKPVDGFLPMVISVAVPMCLVAVEPDIGTALLLATVGLTMCFVGGVRLRHAFVSFLLLVPVLAYSVATRLTYIQNRLNAFFAMEESPTGAAYQQWQSMIALGSGGTYGVGLGHGWQKLFFLPEPYNDFILAIIGEELGLCGTLGVISAYSLLVIWGLRVAKYAVDLYGGLVAIGIVVVIAVQAIVNIAVVTGSVPPKGIALPLISYGGSSLVITLFMIGVLRNIAQATPEPQEVKNG